MGTDSHRNRDKPKRILTTGGSVESTSRKEMTTEMAPQVNKVSIPREEILNRALFASLEEALFELFVCRRCLPTQARHNGSLSLFGFGQRERERINY